MHDVKANILLKEALAPTTAGVTYTGAAIDLSGFRNVSFLISSGQVAGNVNMKIQHSDDGVNFVDSTVADTGEPVAMPQKNAVFSDSLHVTKPTHRYYRVAGTAATASIVAAFAALGGARHLPVTQA